MREEKRDRRKGMRRRERDEGETRREVRETCSVDRKGSVKEKERKRWMEKEKGGTEYIG